MGDREWVYWRNLKPDEAAQASSFTEGREVRWLIPARRRLWTVFS